MYTQGLVPTGEWPSCIEANYYPPPPLKCAPVSHEFLYNIQVILLLIYSYVCIDYHHFQY